MDANDYITNIVKILSLPEQASIQAKKIYDLAIKAALNSDNPKAAIACASIYAWCMKNKVKIMVYEIESASFIESELITKAFGDIQSEIVL